MNLTMRNEVPGPCPASNSSTTPKFGVSSGIRLAIGLLLALAGSAVQGEEPAAAKAFQPKPLIVPEGFDVELAAAPPLVEHPTFATFDEQGRLFLSENAGVNLSAEELLKQLPNSIRMLEDLDGDGKFDRSTVFADKLTFPMGGAWFQGALYVASPPSIWRLEDTDGDGVADRREEIVSKFGFTGNAADIHGCILGPDGRLYWCDGYHGHELTDSSGQVYSKREGSYIFSCRADGSDVRIHCGGGMDNPVEVDFTPAGEMLGTVNILYSRPRVDCFVHWLHGGAYPHRERVLNEIKVTGDFLGPVHKFGHVAVAGTMRYRSGALNPQWKDSFFTTFFNSGTVVRLDLQRSGPTFTATQEELLSCSEREFHPTDLIEDADGSLLVVDTGGWFYRGCPTSQLAKPDILGAVYRIRKSDTKSLTDPRGQQIDWKSLSDEDLLELLGDARFAVRERAIDVATHREDSIVAPLAKQAQHPNPQARLAAVWTLIRRHKMTEALLFLKDEDQEIRLAVLNGLASSPLPAARESLVQFLHRGTLPEQNAAAVALGRSQDLQAVPSLLAILDRDLDRTREHAVIYALIELNRPQATRAGLKAGRPRVCRGTLLALDQMDAGRLAAEDLLPFIAAEDPALQETAITLFSKHKEWTGHAVGVLESLLKDARDSAADNERIFRVAKSFVADPAVAAVIGESLKNSQLPASLRSALFKAMASGQTHPLHESWVKPVADALISDNPQQVADALQILAVCPSRQFQDQLQVLADDEQLPPFERVLALQIHSGQMAALPEAAFDLLVQLLADGSPKERFEAAQKIGACTLTPGQRLNLAERLIPASPAMLTELVRPYGRAVTLEDGRAFLASLKNARSLTSISAEELAALVKKFPAELQPAAQEVIGILQVHRQQQLDRLNALLPRLKDGNAQRGKELFFAEKSKCATCHRVGDQGAKIGPDLSTIGANRTGSDLLESILFPSATIVRDYEPYSLITSDGRVLTGLIARETTDTLFLQPQSGEQIAVPRSEIDELAPGTVSIMPSGLDQTLSEQELADIVAFLQSRKGLHTASHP